MLKINRKLEYGVIALLHLANEPGRSSSVRSISEACKIPEPILSKIMQRMKKGGIVNAVHGNQGGYRLYQSLSDINLFDMNQILVGPVRMTGCVQPGNNQQCPIFENCRLASPMHLLNQQVIGLFKSVSLETLMKGNTAHEAANLHG